MEALHEEMPFDLDFHPSAPLVATSLITGELHLFRYADGLQPERLFAAKAHKESCRAVRFVDSGTGNDSLCNPSTSHLANQVPCILCVILILCQLFFASSRSYKINSFTLAFGICNHNPCEWEVKTPPIVVLETGKAIARLEDAHDNAINRLICLTETTVASGDDEGCVKVWDTRKRSCCNTFHCHEDYISDMTYVASSNQILATSGDGTLSVNNLRGSRVKAQSEFSEDELLSLVVMKNGQKVVCGTPSGALLLYSWGHFKDCSDRFLGHSQSVDTLLKLDEETLISGAADGVIRLVSILPNQIKQPLAEHSEYPIEALGFSHDRKYLGSISHDKILKLWDMEELLGGPQLDGHNELPEAAAAANHDELPEASVVIDHKEVAEADSDDDGMDVDMEPSSSTVSKSKKKGKGKRSNGFQPDFFADL